MKILVREDERRLLRMKRGAPAAFGEEGEAALARNVSRHSDLIALTKCKIALEQERRARRASSDIRHGRLNPEGWHGGDLPNILVDSTTRNGSLDAVAESLTMNSGSRALLDADGSAIIVHANRDDERTDTGPLGPGNSGPRIACGVLRAAPP